MKKERAPAQIVSCPHCDWKGSARGLYTHCRMGHPNKSLPETKGTRVMYTIHPQAEKGKEVPKKRLKSKKERMWEYEERFLKLVEMYLYSQMPKEEREVTRPIVTQLAGIPEDSFKKLTASDMFFFYQKYVKNPELIREIEEKSFRAKGINSQRKA
jgi:hypothetical protein